jgi:putative phosphoesterase
MLVGVVSDTHGHLDERLLAAFAGVNAILHAGDVGGRHVLDGLRALAPLYAVRGNNDDALGGLGLPQHLDLELEELRFHLVHQLPEAKPAEGTDAIVFGHSHRRICEWRDGALYLNPGAAGLQGFHSLLTATLLRIDGASVEMEHVDLGARPPRSRSPGRTQPRRG